MEQEQRQEIRGLYQILEHTAEIAEDALLTETYKDSESRCISQFNKVLQRLSEINAVPKDLFDPLQEDAAFSEISIACHHLAAYISEGVGTASDLKGMMTNLLGKKFIENIGEELKEGRIGDLIRKSMPEFLTETALDDINKTFSVTTDGKLILDTDFGSIDVQTAETEVVNIVVRRSAQLKADRQAAEILKDFRVDFNQQGNELQINAKFKEGRRYWKNTTDRLDIHFEITVPQTYHGVFLKTAGGDISVVGLNGIIQCRTTRGELQFEDIIGPIFGHTGQGNVRVTKCKSDVRMETLRGNIEINENVGSVETITSGGNLRCTDVVGAISGETSGGNIKLIRCKGGAKVEASGGNIDMENDGPVTAKTLGGSINVNISGQLQDNSILEASGGDINVSLISEILVKIDAKSSGGEVTSELPVATLVQDDPKAWQLQGVVNGDGPLLTLRCIGGDINLKCSNTHNDT